MTEINFAMLKRKITSLSFQWGLLKLIWLIYQIMQKSSTYCELHFEFSFTLLIQGFGQQLLLTYDSFYSKGHFNTVIFQILLLQFNNMIMKLFSFIFAAMPLLFCSSFYSFCYRSKLFNILFSSMKNTLNSYQIISFVCH